MKYIIIGLGIYGENLARNLTASGNEVIGADIRRSNVEMLKNDISAVYIIDSTDMNQLSVLPLRNVDLVIVAIGENFGASIKTVALLKSAGVGHIYARAIDDIHRSILESFEIDRILTPEQRAAADLTAEMELGEAAVSLRIDSDRVVAQLGAPDHLIGITYAELSSHLGSDDITLIAAARGVSRSNILGIRRSTFAPLPYKPDTTVERGDTVTVCGTKKKILDTFKIR